jgi:hypothetical protein
MCCASAVDITEGSYDHARYYRFDLQDSLMDRSELTALELMIEVNRARVRSLS